MWHLHLTNLYHIIFLSSILATHVKSKEKILRGLTELVLDCMSEFDLLSHQDFRLSLTIEEDKLTTSLTIGVDHRSKFYCKFELTTRAKLTMPKVWPYLTNWVVWPALTSWNFDQVWLVFRLWFWQIFLDNLWNCKPC